MKKAEATCPALNGSGDELVPKIVEETQIQSQIIGKLSNSNQRNVIYDKESLSPTIQAALGEGGGNCPLIIDDKVLIRQNTKDGLIPCKIGGVADLNYPESKTRRGRVIENGEICPTLTTENIPNVIEDWVWEIDGQKYLIRIRKLTPKECWRLMGFTDDEFQKAESVVSNTQLYKQAGNSIVVDVLENVFRQIILQRREE